MQFVEVRRLRRGGLRYPSEPQKVVDKSSLSLDVGGYSVSEIAINNMP